MLSALVPGFVVGSLLFFVRLTGDSTGAWSVAATSAHGHAQIFGWAGLLVLGVGFHFLPRLAGVKPVRPALSGIAFALLFGSIFSRVIVQPFAASDPDSKLLELLLAGIAGAALLGGVLMIGVLLGTLAQRESRAGSGAMRPVLPFLALSAAGFLIALAANLWRFLAAGGLPDTRVASDLDQIVVLTGFYLFLIPISVGMSVRTLPLYIQGLPVYVPLLQAGLVVLTVGTVSRLLSVLDVASLPSGMAAVSQGIGLIMMILAVRVFDRRRPLPRRAVRPLHDARQVTIISAYAWLSLCAVLLVVDGLGWRSLNHDLELHLLGAGFITLLIFGVGAHLLPGFSRGAMRNEGVAWATVILANLSVLLRLSRYLPGISPGDATDFSGGIAGGFAFVAVLLFAWNVRLLGRAAR